MSRTTLDIDDKLLEKAMHLAGARTKTEVVELALQELVRERERDLLRRELGTFELQLDLEALRQMRRVG